jgi:hypothetical protein
VSYNLSAKSENIASRSLGPGASVPNGIAADSVRNNAGPITKHQSRYASHAAAMDAIAASMAVADHANCGAASGQYRIGFWSVGCLYLSRGCATVYGLLAVVPYDMKCRV